MIEAKLLPSVEEYSRLAALYSRNPALFCREMCGLEPCEWQGRFLNALLTDKFIARPSGHSTGKTRITAVSMLWMLMFFPGCHIRATSATYDHLTKGLWEHLRTVISESALSLWVSINSQTAANRLYPGNWALALAWSKDKAQAWAGEHCEHPVGVFDECSDIDDIIYEAWSGSAHHGGSRTILLGQPRFRHGKLFKAARDPKFNTEHVSSIGCPFAPAELAKAAADEYGEDSDYYRVRVEGLFPRADSSQMFPGALGKRLEPAAAPEQGAEREPALAGLDIAKGGGDFSVLFIRRGNEVVFCQKWDTADHPALAHAVLERMAAHSCNTVAADVNGIGAGLGDMLPLFGKGVTVIPVRGQEKARNRRKYHNRRSEAYGRLSENWDRMRFASGKVSPADLENLCKQLDSVRIVYDRDMRIAVLPKPEMKQELGGRSPDLADALAYSFLAYGCGSDYSDCMESPESREKKRLRSAEICRAVANSNPYRR